MSWKITSYFGAKESFRNQQTGHTGIDFATPDGTPLRSIQDGTVEEILRLGDKNVGNGVLIRWEDGKTAIYGHLSKFAEGLKEGDTVNAGDLIGYSGHSGHVVSSSGSNGAHLHFGLKDTNGKFIDPSPYIDHIQNMNNQTYLAKIAEELPKQTDNLFTIGNIFGNKSNFNTELLNLFKSNFISIIVEVKSMSINFLADNSILIQYLKHFFQFFS